MLSDETAIAGTTWRALRESAMVDNYQQMSWWVSTTSFLNSFPFLQFPLSNEDKDLLEALRGAQQAQGDLLAL